MKNQHRNRNPLGVLSIVLAAAMMVLAGCGGSDGDTPDAAETPATEPAGEDHAGHDHTGEAHAEEEAAAAAPTGVLGRVTFDGPQPERPEISTTADAKCAILHGGEPLISELRVVSADGGVEHSFVYVKNPPEGEYPVPTEPALLDQVGCMYVPHIVGMRAGQPLNVKNSDETTHNIRSYSKANKPFNISQPVPGVRERQFPNPEASVKIKCDFHPWMTAYVFAMEHPYFAVTDADGNFEISDLPDGEYTLVAWHETWGEQEATLTVADGSGEASFTFTE
jgi:hypothetical protein